MRSLSNYHHPYTLVFISFILILLPTLSISSNVLSAAETLTVSSNKTILSPSGIFELGFFNPGSGSRWYLGIWYKEVPKRTYVWVANRDTPLSHSTGSLKISDNNLIIFDLPSKPVWSTNITGGNVRSPVVAELLDNGNFVLRHSNNNDPDGFLWQSFDYPTDTLLPEMILGWDLKSGINRFLRSWKTADDPTSGDFSTRFETRGLPEIYVCNKESAVYRTGPWNGVRFSGIPEARPVEYLVLDFTANDEEITYSYQITKSNIYSILSLSSTGLVQRSTWIERLQIWKPLWYSPKDICNSYKQCGSYSYCDSNTSPVCN